MKNKEYKPGAVSEKNDKEWTVEDGLKNDKYFLKTE
jgi:hypothetical protein